ncbi:putative diguanylate cyclase YedQ [compost metagenome]
MAALLAEAVGAGHFVGRFGGEEFVAVLPGIDADAAVAIAERCRTRIADAAIPHLRSPYEQRVTASFGVGTTLPAPGAEPTAFINLVDAQLYHAKDNGRNRIAAVDRAGMQGEGFRTHSR